MAQKITVRCTGAATLNLAELEPFQGELKDLSKEAYESLKNEIVETGFAFPFNVWRSGGKNYLTGGHQRFRVLKTLENMGWTIPALPVNWVEAENFKEAKRRVLQDAAQYGKINEDGLYEFMISNEIDAEDLMKSFVLPEVKLPRFVENFFEDGDNDDAPEATEKQRSASDDVKQIVLKYDTATAGRVEGFCEVLAHQYGTKSMSDTIFRALEWCFGTGNRSP